jgi:hypothetical protein
MKYSSLLQRKSDGDKKTANEFITHKDFLPNGLQTELVIFLSYSCIIIMI